MDSDTTGREFDIVLVGATGFVGRLVARHLAEAAGPHVKIGLAGRNAGRLEETRATLPAAAHDWPLIETDITDWAQAEALAPRARVVCSTVGPYEEYGKQLVLACADAGTHYCDLTGETTFVRWSLDTADATAQRTGARIVHSCGFDSVPSDLGVFETARAAARAGDGALTDTVTRVRSMRGGLSGGTFASLRGQIVMAREDKQVRRLATDPYALSPDRDREPRGAAPTRPRGGVAGALNRVGVRRSDSGRWEAPFFMAVYNPLVVRMSNARSGWSYGRDFRYGEVVDTGSGVPGVLTAAATTVGLGALFGGMATAPTRVVLDRILPAAGEGPSEASMKRGKFVFDVEADTTAGARYRTRVADNRDPGYTSTAVMLGQSALALAAGEEGETAYGGGVLTPATALGGALVERLRAHGFTIETRRL